MKDLTVKIDRWYYSKPTSEPNDEGNVVLISMHSVAPAEVFEWGINAEKLPYERYKWCEDDLYENSSYCKTISEEELLKQLDSVALLMLEHGCDTYAAAYREISSKIGQMLIDLKRYDGKCVRIIDADGNVFDGICRYDHAEYNEVEFGRNEDCLRIENFLFFQNDIRSIESLEEHEGPYGRFLDPYGKLEEMTVEDDIDSIRDILFSEENEHVLRLLNCLGRYLDPCFGYDLPYYSEILDALRELIEYNPNRAIREEAERLLELWGT